MSREKAIKLCEMIFAIADNDEPDPEPDDCIGSFQRIKNLASQVLDVLAEIEKEPENKLSDIVIPCPDDDCCGCLDVKDFIDRPTCNECGKVFVLLPACPQPESTDQIQADTNHYKSVTPEEKQHCKICGGSGNQYCAVHGTNGCPSSGIGCKRTKPCPNCQQPEPIKKDEDCEFCFNRRYYDSRCLKHNKKVFIDSKSCQDYISGGPQTFANRKQPEPWRTIPKHK